MTFLIKNSEMKKRIVGTFLLSGVMVFSLAGDIAFNGTVSEATKKPTLTSGKSVTLSEGGSKTLKVSAKGYKVKSVKATSSNLTFATVKATKKAVTITGGMKGFAKITTTIKAKKGKKTKLYKVTTNVTVTETPFYQECTGNMSVTVIDPLTLKIAFPEVVSYINQTRVRIHTSDGTQLIIQEGGISSEDGGKTHILKLVPTGVTAGITYIAEFMDREETATFRYERKHTAIYFKDGTSTSFKKVPFEAGAKIGALPLAANPYNQNVSYKVSGGKDMTAFEVDENGILCWHKTNGINDELKTFEVEVTAETEQTDILEGATATIFVTVTKKK